MAQTDKETVTYKDIAEALQRLQEFNVPPTEDDTWIARMHPGTWFGLKWLFSFTYYKEFLRTYVWSSWRKRLWPWLLPSEKLQAIIMKDDLMMLYCDYEFVEVEWKKKEIEDG